MKTSYDYIYLCIVMILLSLLGCGCSKEKQEVLVVYGSQSELSDENSEAVARQWAEEKNISLQFVAPKLSTVYEQQKVLEESIREKKWDLIVVEPLGGREFYPILDYAKKQGSIVTAVQGSLELGADYTIQPCDYEELGVLMMDVFAEKMKESGSYVTVVPTKDSEIALQEELACVNHQKNNYQQMMASKRLEEGTDTKSAYTAVDSLYQAYEMDGVLFFSYIDGLGISQWKQNTKKDLITVGLGDPKLMDTADGTIDALFYWNRDHLLIASLEVGYKAMEGNVKKDQDVITTNIEGYKTLRSLGNGIYYGSDISTTYKED